MAENSPGIMDGVNAWLARQAVAVAPTVIAAVNWGKDRIGEENLAAIAPNETLIRSVEGSLPDLNRAIASLTNNLVNIGAAQNVDGQLDAGSSAAIQNTVLTLRVLTNIPATGEDDALWKYSPEVGRRTLEALDAQIRGFDETKTEELAQLQDHRTQAARLVTAFDEMHARGLMPNAAPVSQDLERNEIILHGYVVERGMAAIAAPGSPAAALLAGAKLETPNGTLDTTELQGLNRVFKTMDAMLPPATEGAPAFDSYTPEFGASLLERLQASPVFGSKAPQMAQMIASVDALYNKGITLTTPAPAPGPHPELSGTSAVTPTPGTLDATAAAGDQAPAQPADDSAVRDQILEVERILIEKGMLVREPNEATGVRDDAYNQAVARGLATVSAVLDVQLPQDLAYTPQLGADLLKAQQEKGLMESLPEAPALMAALDEIYEHDHRPGVTPPANNATPGMNGVNVAQARVESASMIAERGLIEIAGFLRTQGATIADMGTPDGTFDDQSQTVLQQSLVNIRRYLGMYGEDGKNLHVYTPEIGTEILERLRERSQDDPALAQQMEKVPMLINALDTLHGQQKIKANPMQDVDTAWMPGVQPFMYNMIEKGLMMLQDHMPGLLQQFLPFANMIFGFISGGKWTIEQAFPRVFQNQDANPSAVGPAASERNQPPAATDPAAPGVNPPTVSAYMQDLPAGSQLGPLVDQYKGLFRNQPVAQASDLVSEVTSKMIRGLSTDLTAEQSAALAGTISECFENAKGVYLQGGPHAMDHAALTYAQAMHQGLAAFNAEHGTSLKVQGMVLQAPNSPDAEEQLSAADIQAGRHAKVQDFLENGAEIALDDSRTRTPDFQPRDPGVAYSIPSIA